MANVSALSCVSCGAPLELASGPTVRCQYCDRVLTVSGSTLEVEPGHEARTEVDDLLAGYSGDVGQGRRYSSNELPRADWQAELNGLWPVRATASSSFGPGWDTDSIVGPPTVFPRSGDIAGAWAPRPKTSHVEWVQAHFPEGAPLIDRVRVFETCAPGAVFAVTIIERGREDVGEQCLWQRRPAELRGAHILEVPVDPPRHVAAARVYLTNHHATSWSEIDSIGLMAIAPVPESLRSRAHAVAPRERRVRKWPLVVLAVLATATALLMVVRGDRAAPAVPLERSRERPPASVEGVIPTTSTPAVEELEGIVWANAVLGASSQYSSEGWSQFQVFGAPDVYPRHGDDKGAWASLSPNAGLEWIEVKFDPPRDASAIMVVETFNPGAVVRVDDLTDRARPVLLWSGSSPPSAASRVLRLSLPAPRRIGGVRLFLDTRRSEAWNEIDAVGLVPAG